MTRTQIYLPTDLYEQAKLIAQAQGKSISQLIRLGLQQVLTVESQKKSQGFSKLVGKYRGAPTNLALDHNSIYLDD